jgi:hypothetical protein
MEKIAVCSQIHTEHTNARCVQNVVFWGVKPDGKYSDHWALKRQLSTGKALLIW